MREPVELALHIVENAVAYIREDGGEKAALLELLMPGEHGVVLRRPHAGIPEVQFLELRIGVRSRPASRRSSARRRSR